MRTFILTTQEAEGGGLEVGGQPQQLVKALSQNIKDRGVWVSGKAPPPKKDSKNKEYERRWYVAHKA